MLEIPEKGISRSTSNHNVDVGVLVDWIEGSALFLQEPVSRSDISDNLIEEKKYDDQDFAAELVDDAWAEMQRRASRAKYGYPISLKGRSIKATQNWIDVAPYSMCLWLSLVVSSPSWRASTDKDYPTQGELFERLTVEIMKTFGWSVLGTGWSRTQVSKLSPLVDSIAEHLNEPVLVGGIKRWTSPRAKDAGLDVVCRKPFADLETGDPRYLMQCASGADWKKKLCTPNLRTWEKLIDFANPPQRGFAMPFCLSSEVFRRSVLIVEGMFLDRLRITDGEPGWESAALKKDINSWLKPRIENLPTR